MITPDRALWRTVYSLYDGALKRLDTMEPAQVWEWFFDAVEAQEQHNQALLFTDLVIAIHEELERIIERKGESAEDG